MAGCGTAALSQPFQITALAAAPFVPIFRPMDRRTAMDILRAHADEIRKRGATALYLYGSTCRDEARPDSDVDVFIDYDMDSFRFTLVQFIRLQDYLSEILGVEADLATRDALHPVIKQDILAEAERVF
jgi:predicted nucleotidyltransferase